MSRNPCRCRGAAQAEGLSKEGKRRDGGPDGKGESLRLSPLPRRDRCRRVPGAGAATAPSAAALAALAENAMISMIYHAF
jgi:hypothetical protein